MLILCQSLHLQPLLSGSGSLAQHGFLQVVLRDLSFHHLVQNLQQRGSLFLDLDSLSLAYCSFTPTSLAVGRALLSVNMWTVPPFLWSCEAPREFLKRHFDQGASVRAAHFCQSPLLSCHPLLIGFLRENKGATEAKERLEGLLGQRTALRCFAWPKHLLSCSISLGTTWWRLAFVENLLCSSHSAEHFISLWKADGMNVLGLVSKGSFDSFHEDIEAKSS